MAAKQVPPRSHGFRVARAPRSYVMREALLPLQRFIHSETAGAVLLFAAAVLALAWANSPWSTTYFRLWQQTLSIDLGVFALTKDLRHWINDGLMALFFFLVGLEIKRELVHGELSDARQAALPGFAALGGMVGPALLYLALNAGGEGERGWGIPMATDIAFALAVLALAGPRIPSSARVFLLALAIADDIGAILVIALFYTQELAVGSLAISCVLLAVIVIMRRMGARNALAYAVVGTMFWAAVLKSGVHATIAGVVLGILTPANPPFARSRFVESAELLVDRIRKAEAEGNRAAAEAVLGQFEELSSATEAPVERLERKVHPWISYLVLPLFGLANTGVSLGGQQWGELLRSPVLIGIAIGLMLGKPLGILAFTWAAVRFKVSKLPPELTWQLLGGLGLLAGIGFTVSLFIAGLAFEEQRLLSQSKIAILAASLMAGLFGFLFLRRAAGTRQSARR